MWFKCCYRNRAVAPASPRHQIENNNSLGYNSWSVKPKLSAWFNKKDKVLDGDTSLSNSITLIKLPSPTISNDSRSSYNGKENGFVRSPIINSEASRSEPSLVRSPHGSPVRSSDSLSAAKSIENGLAASSPSLGAIEESASSPRHSSRLGTPVVDSVHSSLVSVVSQPHLENGSADRDFIEEERISKNERRNSDGDFERPKTPNSGFDGSSRLPQDDGGETTPSQEEDKENESVHLQTPNDHVGTPNSEMSESSRGTEMTTKSTESLKSVTFGEEVKPRRKIPRGPDIKKRSRTVGFDVKSETISSLYPQSLPPFDNSRDAITKAVLQLENPEWEVIMQGLQAVVRLVRHHTKDVQGGVTHSFVVPITKHIKNLRSQVSRSACQCAGELFSTLGKHMDSEVEDLAASLLSRMADTNKFLRGDSCSALEAMVDHTSPSKSVAALVSKGAKHQNAVVRGATCRLLLRLCNRLGPERTLALPKDTRDAILLTGAKFLTEGSLETRKYAKEMFSMLSTSHRLNGILADVIPHNIMRNITKILARITS
uniref:TOG domain-containing protein n=1 Tax=Lygus hesperus TaxID=30085 RepID=A0A0K8SM82_LYGHE